MKLTIVADGDEYATFDINDAGVWIDDDGDRVRRALSDALDTIVTEIQRDTQSF